jgi:hypothetical protein
MKLGVFFGAAVVAALAFAVPAQASSNFDYNLAPTPGQGTDLGFGGFSLSVNPTSFGDATNLASYATNFSFTVDGNVFNRTNELGNLTIEFIKGALYDVTYSGSFVDKAGDRVTLDISGTGYVYYDQSRTGETVTYGSLDQAAIAPVPEPSSLLLLLPGVFLLGFSWMRNRRSGSAVA